MFDLAAVEPDEILQRIECQDIWGIGSRTAAKLLRAGIRTALDLKHADIPWIRNELGVVGERIARELNGISCLAMEEVPASKKAIASARSFGHQVESIDEIQQALSTYIARVAEKLRAEKLLAARMEVFVETNPFKPELPQYNASAQTTFLRPTNQAPVLISRGLELLRKVYRPGFQYKKTGVMLTELIPGDRAQRSQFSSQMRGGKQIPWRRCRIERFGRPAGTSLGLPGFRLRRRR